jgi:hypothetical protein
MIGKELINKYRKEKIQRYIEKIDKLYEGKDPNFLNEYIEELLAENEEDLLPVLNALELMHKQEMIKKGINHATSKAMGRIKQKS